MKKILEMVKNFLNNGEEVTDYDINCWLDDDTDFQELINYLKENGIVSIYDEKKDTYVYLYKSEEK